MSVTPTSRNLCIYIFANASMPGLFKVGITAMEILEDRARHLYTTGVPTPFAYVWHKETQFAREIENRLKKWPAARRNSEYREFYCADVPTLIRLIEEFHEAEVASGKDVSASPDDTEPIAQRRYRSFSPCCEVVEGPDGTPKVVERGLRSPVVDLLAPSPLPYPVHWLIVDTIGIERDIEVDLRDPQLRKIHGPWIAGSVIADCLEDSAEELPSDIVAEHSVMGVAAMDWIFQRAFEQLAGLGFEFGDSPDFWVAAWAWARRLLSKSDNESVIQIVSAFPYEWLGVSSRPIPQGPKGPLVMFSGPIIERFNVPWLKDK
jgi:hypothetical protein